MKPRPRYEVVQDDNATSPQKTAGRYSLVEEGDEKQPPQLKDMVSTMFGQMERNPKEFERNSPESQKLLNEMISSAMPGAGLYAGGREIISELLGKAFKGIGNTVRGARANIAPVEKQAAQEIGGAEQRALKAGEIAGEEEANAVKPKPGVYEAPKTELEGVESEIGKHLNIGAQHDVKAANAIVNRGKDIESFWSDAFQQLEGKLGEAKFEMPEQAMSNLGYDQAEIMKRLRAGADPKTVVKEMEAEKAASQNPYYKDLIKYAPTSADVSAKDFLTKYRDFRDALGGLKQDLRSENIMSGEKQKIKEAITKAKDVETQIKSALNEGLGEFKPEFDWINKGYSEQVFPLRQNPIYRNAKLGKLPKNILESLRTNEPGMDMMREIVKQDPELLRNVVGQRYRVKPSEIHKPDALLQEYLDEMPEFKKLIQRKESVMAKTAKRKDIALSEKVRLEKELTEIRKHQTKLVEDAKAAKKAAKKKLKKGAMIAGGAAGGYLGVPYAFNKAANFLTGD